MGFVSDLDFLIIFFLFVRSEFRKTFLINDVFSGINIGSIKSGLLLMRT